MRTILILLLIILHTQIQAQTTRIENDLFVKVVTKFKKDKESFEEFKYLGLCHCINSVLENEEDLFFGEYIDYYNRCSALTRLLNKEVLKNTFAIYESKLKDLKNNTEKLNQCFLLYNQRKLKQCYIQTISNRNNYIEDEEIQLFMEDYLNLGRVDIHRFIEGKNLWKSENNIEKRIKK